MLSHWCRPQLGLASHAVQDVLCIMWFQITYFQNNMERCWDFLVNNMTIILFAFCFFICFSLSLCLLFVCCVYFEKCVLDYWIIRELWCISYQFLASTYWRKHLAQKKFITIQNFGTKSQIPADFLGLPWLREAIIKKLLELYEIKASEMLVAPRISECFGLGLL